MIRCLPLSLLPLIAVFKNTRIPLHSRSTARFMAKTRGHQLCRPSSVFRELIVGGRKEARVGAWISGLAAGDGVGERVRIIEHAVHTSTRPN
jgi:hypothetical protein